MGDFEFVFRAYVELLFRCAQRAAGKTDRYNRLRPTNYRTCTLVIPSSRHDLVRTLPAAAVGLGLVLLATGLPRCLDLHYRTRGDPVYALAHIVVC